ncbi:MAG: DUF4381 domain-containing protein [Proteobacteria bacterium]|nr:MAG: DUF4381 domain-containing protein [Pseudomonadota bacterium]
MSQDLSQLNLVELLDLLEPIPEPAPISLWPETAGWIWVGIVLLASGAWCVRRWHLHRYANAYRRAALREIAIVGNEPVALADILRRAALAAYPRAEVAGLHAEKWLAFLDKSYGGTGFREGPGRVIAIAPYRPVDETPGIALLATEWVRRHCQNPVGLP